MCKSTAPPLTMLLCMATVFSTNAATCGTIKTAYDDSKCCNSGKENHTVAIPNSDCTAPLGRSSPCLSHNCYNGKNMDGRDFNTVVDVSCVSACEFGMRQPSGEWISAPTCLINSVQWSYCSKYERSPLSNYAVPKLNGPLNATCVDSWDGGKWRGAENHCSTKADSHWCSEFRKHIQSFPSMSDPLIRDR